MKLSIHACLLILALASVGSAQTAQNDARELWLVRAQNITTDLLKDGADLSSMQRAVLWGKLAKQWWHEDPKRARTWIVNAIDVVEQVPNKESEEERRQRLETAQVLLTIVTPLDPKLNKRLLPVLSPDKTTRDERNGTADALFKAASVIVQDDPKRAAELASLAMRTGKPFNNIDPLFYGLRERDPKLADSLFAQALELAKSDPGGMFTNILTYIAFPAQRRGTGNIPVPAEPLRVELLQILMTLINANPANGENQNSNCGAVIWLGPLYGEIERLLPQQWPTLRQAINACQSSSSLIQQHIKRNSSDSRFDTVDSILKAAAEVTDVNLRTDYQARAARLAAENKDYELAVKILDDMTKEQRDAMRESWTSARWDWAADGAVEHYQKDRFREMNLILEGVPSDLRPLAKVAFVHRLPEKAVSETGPFIQIFRDALNELRRSNLPAAEKADWYLGLIKPVVKYQPADANAVLKDIVTSFNQVKDSTALDTTESFGVIGPPLLEMDEFVVKDALASVTHVQTRALMRLALLNATMQRLKSN